MHGATIKVVTDVSGATYPKAQFDPWKMGATGSPETSVLGNIPEEQRSYLHRARSLGTHILLGPIIQIARRQNTTTVQIWTKLMNVI